jgi:iron complex outermembrane receptor protein
MNNVNHHRKALFVGIMGASALLLAEGTMAQDDVTDLGIEEMVVTAQKREENVQAVPISISTLSANDIERRGVQSSSDLVGTIPNMGGFQPPGAKGNVAVTMRGVSSGSPSNLSLDTAIGVYIDGVILGKQVGSALDVAEIERIEVLRGPQGTLYGRNSTGGAVNFITKKPTGEFGGKITGTVGSEGLWAYKANVDTPAIGTEGEGLGTLAASGGVQGRERDALHSNRVPGGEDLDDIDREAYRAALRWDATEAITIDYSYDHSELDEANPAQITVGMNPAAVRPTEVSRVSALQGYVAAGNAGLAGAGPLAVAAAGDPTFGRWLNSAKATLDALQNDIGDGSRRSYAYSDSDSGSVNESDGHNLTGTWQVDDLGALGSVEFKSITGYREVEARNIGDLDGLDNTIAAGGAGALNDPTLGQMFQFYGFQSQFPAALLQYPRAAMATLWSQIDQNGNGGYFIQDARFEYDQFSQELQMVGSTERLEYAVGLYYFEDDGSFDNLRRAAIPLGGVLSTAYDNDTEATAFYTQFTWTPPVLDDKLALTLGYRRTEEEKGITYRYLDDGASTGNGLFLRPCSGLQQASFCVNPNYSTDLRPTPTYGDKFDQKFSNDSGSATVAYQLTDDTNVFLRWSSGYRSGGYNGEIYNNPFEEETIEQYEFGVKSDILPGTLRVNASIFEFEYDDLQTSQIAVSSTGQLTSFIGNAGQAERWGAEVEVQWSPLDDLLVALSYAHMDGDFEEFPPVCGGPTGSNCIDADNLAQRAQSPDDSASLVTDWVFARTEWAEFMAHVELFWQDETAAAALWSGTYGTAPNTVPYVFPDIMLDDRIVVNARLGIENVELGGGTLRSSLWVRNAFDEDYPSYGFSFLTGGPILEQYAEPRTYGLDVTWEF